MEIQISHENELFDIFFCIFVIHFTKYLYIWGGQRYKKFITSLQFANNRIAEGALFAPILLQRLESAALPIGHEPLYSKVNFPVLFLF